MAKTKSPPSTDAINRRGAMPMTGRSTNSVVRPPRRIGVGSVQIDVVDLGVSEAQAKWAEVISAAIDQGVKFRIGNKRKPNGGAVILMAAGELSKLVELTPRTRTGAEILAGMPFAGTRLPALRSTAPDDDTRVLKIPTSTGS